MLFGISLEKKNCGLSLSWGWAGVRGTLVDCFVTQSVGQLICPSLCPSDSRFVSQSVHLFFRLSSSQHSVSQSVSPAFFSFVV